MFLFMQILFVQPFHLVSGCSMTNAINDEEELLVEFPRDAR
jgi:hypothetical protein